MKQIDIAVIIIISCIVLDQLTKILAKIKLKNKRSIHVFKNHYYFTYVENSGMAMGKNDGKYYLFFAITIISLSIYSVFTKEIDFLHNTWFSIGLSILIGGTFGNLIDRVLRGYVIDFITGEIFHKHLPVYNLADFFIFIGSLLAVIFAIIEF